MRMVFAVVMALGFMVVNAEARSVKNDAVKPAAQRKIASIKLGDEMEMTDKALQEKLLPVLKKDGDLVATGQGWHVHMLAVRCFYPEGTGNDADQPYCDFVKVKTPPQHK